MPILAPALPAARFPIFHDHCANGPAWLKTAMEEEGDDSLLKREIHEYCIEARETEALEPITAILEEQLLKLLDEWRHGNGRARYREYLAGESWTRTRAKVLERAEYVCEGCRERRATQVHHLNYDDPRGEEMLFNLVALCADCHDKLSRKT